MKNILKNKTNIVGVVVVLLVLVGGYYGWTSYQAMQNSPEAQAAKLEQQKVILGYQVVLRAATEAKVRAYFELQHILLFLLSVIFNKKISKVIDV